MADDLTQETSLLAGRKLSSLCGDSVSDSWLYRIATDTVLRYLQKEFFNSLDIADWPEAGKSDDLRA